MLKGNKVLVVAQAHLLNVIKQVSIMYGYGSLTVEKCGFVVQYNLFVFI